MDKREKMVIIPEDRRSGALPGLFAALKKIYITPKWNEQMLRILEVKIYSKNNQTGRKGMDL